MMSLQQNVYSENYLHQDRRKERFSRKEDEAETLQQCTLQGNDIENS